MSEYRAIVFDLDGTAVPNSADGIPSARLVSAIAKYQRQVHLIAATGRPVAIAIPTIEALGLIEPSIVSGGTVILAAQSHKVIKHTPLPRAALEAVFALVRRRGYNLYFRDEFISPAVATLHPSIGENVEIVYIANIPTAELADITAELEAVPHIATSAVPNWEGPGFVLNVTHEFATKEHAVAEVLAGLGVPQAEAIGVGDGNNDIHLFRSVGLKVAMGNAGPELKAAADLITGSVDEDGLADIIERYAA